MEKIDRLGWAAGISFASYGVRVGVRANSPLALRLARDYLPPGWKASSSRLVDRLYSLILPTNGASRAMRRFNLLYADIAKLARTTDSEKLSTCSHPIFVLLELLQQWNLSTSSGLLTYFQHCRRRRVFQSKRYG